MIKTKAYKQDWEVESKLANFGATKQELLKVVMAAVGARADATPHDPVTAGGTFSYIYGTRSLRNLFVQKGWVIDSTDNIESVYHPPTGTKIIFQNSVWAANDKHDPRAISAKGKASERLIALNIRNLFEDLEKEDLKKINTSVWYFCVAGEGGNVTAELSRPMAVVEGQFGRFIERIYILNPGEWDALDITDFDDDLIGGEQDFEINVTRKK